MQKDMAKVIKEWKDEAGVKSIIQIEAHPDKTLRICTVKPGMMIGKSGELVAKYKKKLQEVYPSIKEIEFIETDHWFVK